MSAMIYLQIDRAGQAVAVIGSTLIGVWSTELRAMAWLAASGWLALGVKVRRK